MPAAFPRGASGLPWVTRKGGVSHRLVFEQYAVWVMPLGAPQHSRSTQAKPAHVWFALEAPASRIRLCRVNMESW
eukprot:5295834-Amphidinium_carterae.1